jgi:hypothetical protein
MLKVNALAIKRINKVTSSLLNHAPLIIEFQDSAAFLLYLFEGLSPTIQVPKFMVGPEGYITQEAVH